MAIISNVYGTCSLSRGYSFYARVMINDAVNPAGNVFVTIITILVNGGMRTNSDGWTENITLNNIGQETLTGQTIDTTSVDRNGGETWVQTKIFVVPSSLSSISFSAYASRSTYSQYDPGYCSVSGTVSMPKFASTWSSSLVSIPNIEQGFTLPINKYVSNYYNVVEVRNNNNTVLIKTINDAVDGTSVSFTSSELNTIYSMDNNANQLPLRFFMDLKTYTDSTKTTQIGSTQRTTCEAYLVNSEPTMLYSTEELDSNVIAVLGSEISEYVIKDASDLLFTMTATANNGASISGITINGTPAILDNGSYSLEIPNLTTGTFNIVVTDSRGLTSTYTATRILLDYVPVNINSNWTANRASQVSSDIVLNAVIDCYSSDINSNPNDPTVKYSLDNSNWVTIPNTSYTFQDNKITISNLTLSNILSYQQTGTFYLRVYDILTSHQDSRRIPKGIETFSYGESDFQINGDLVIADTDGSNGVNVLSSINNLSTNLGTLSGTVSTIENGTIQETGTNNNGTYIKYKNGIMICTKYFVTANNIPISTTWGNGYTSGDANMVSLGNFASTFYSMPVVSVTLNRYGGYNAWLGALRGTTESFIGDLTLLRFSSNSGVKYAFHIIAIGRWKA